MEQGGTSEPFHEEAVIDRFYVASSFLRFFWKSEYFEFQSYGGAWHNATIEFVKKKNILISWFWALLEVRALEKEFMQMLVCSVEIISCSDSQSKFQIC